MFIPKVRLMSLAERRKKIDDAPIQASYGRFVFLKDAKGYYRSTVGNKSLHRALCKSKKRGWHVHHIDMCTVNNKRKNLIALPEELHMYIHVLIKMTGYTYICPRAECERLLSLFKKGKLDLSNPVLPDSMGGPSFAMAA